MSKLVHTSVLRKKYYDGSREKNELMILMRVRNVRRHLGNESTHLDRKEEKKSASWLEKVCVVSCVIFLCSHFGPLPTPLRTPSVWQVKCTGTSTQLRRVRAHDGRTHNRTRGSLFLFFFFYICARQFMAANSSFIFPIVFGKSFKISFAQGAPHFLVNLFPWRRPYFF